MRQLKIINSIVSPSWALLLCSCGLLMQVYAQQGDQALKFNFSYSFFPGKAGNSTPPLQNINKLICGTNEYLSLAYQEALSNPAVQVEAIGIDYNFDAGTTTDIVKYPLSVSFTTNFTTTDGSTVPSVLKLAAIQLKNYFDVTTYITKYLWPKGGILPSIMGTRYTLAVGSPQVGMIDTATCDESNGNTTTATTAPSSGDNNNTSGTISVPTVVSLTSAPAAGPAASPMAGPTTFPLAGPTASPITGHITAPSAIPLAGPSASPITAPITGHITAPSAAPMAVPTGAPLGAASGAPSVAPSGAPSGALSGGPIAASSAIPSAQTNEPTAPSSSPIVIWGDTSTTPVPTSRETPTASNASTTLWPTLFTIGGNDIFNGNGNGTIAPTTTGVINTGTGSPTGSSVSSGSSGGDSGMVFFELQYALDLNQADLREPTRTEVNDLMCRTNTFFQDKIRNETSDNTIQSRANNIDWMFTNAPGTVFPVTVTFLSNTTHGKRGKPVPSQTVYDAMMTVKSNDVVNYIMNYVVGELTVSDNIFQFTKAVNFSESTNATAPTGRIPVADCSTTQAPTGMPVSLAPSQSPAPTALPGTTTTSPSPTEAPGPSPTESPSPSPTEAPGPSPTESPSTNTTNVVSPAPTVFQNGSAQTNAPNSSPTVQLSSREHTVSIQFLVSNLVGITDPAAIRNDGIETAWTAFAKEMAHNISNIYEESQRRHALQQYHRHLSIAYVTDSATIYLPNQVACPTGSHSGSTCHMITAEYKYGIVQEDQSKVRKLFEDETQTAVFNGTLQYILDREVPDSPIIIGTIPDPGVFTRQPIAIRFLVSNINGISKPQIVNASGLSESWPVFAMQMFRNLTEQQNLNMSAATSAQGQRLRKAHRRLTVDLEVGSSYVYDIQSVVCPNDKPIHANSLCHNVDAQYVLQLQGENQWALEELYRQATLEEATDGTYDALMRQIVPDTPLHIGTIPPSPTVAPSNRPADAPTTPQSIDPSKKKSNGSFPVKVEFIVSNLDGISDPNIIRSAGLDDSWRLFARDMTRNITENYISPFRRLRGRRLSIDYFADSAKVTDVELIGCPDNRADPNSICHRAKAEYMYTITQEIYTVVDGIFTNETNAAIYNGTFQSIVNEAVRPGISLIIGIIPADSSKGAGDGGSLAGWAIFLIVFFAILAIALCIFCVYYFYFREKEKVIESYQEEDFVYDFLIPDCVRVQTEVDDLSKVVDVEPEDASTESSEAYGLGHPANVEQQETDEDLQAETWEDKDDVGLVPNNDEDDGGMVHTGEDEWEDEVGTSDYAKKAHVLLLRNEGPGSSRLLLQDDNPSARELHRLLLEDGDTSSKQQLLLEGKPQRKMIEDGDQFDNTPERFLLKGENASDSSTPQRFLLEGGSGSDSERQKLFSAGIEEANALAPFQFHPNGTSMEQSNDAEKDGGAGTLQEDSIHFSDSETDIQNEQWEDEELTPSEEKRDDGSDIAKQGNDSTNWDEMTGTESDGGWEDTSGASSNTEDYDLAMTDHNESFVSEATELGY